MNTPLGNIPQDRQGEIMQVHEFAILQSLSQLIENGQWPGSVSDYYRQEADSPIGEEVVQRIFPDFDKIVFMNTPFHTIGDEVGNGNDFWRNRL